MVPPASVVLNPDFTPHRSCAAVTGSIDLMEDVLRSLHHNRPDRQRGGAVQRSVRGHPCFHQRLRLQRLNIQSKSVETLLFKPIRSVNSASQTVSRADTFVQTLLIQEMSLRSFKASDSLTCLPFWHVTSWNGSCVMLTWRPWRWSAMGLTLSFCRPLNREQVSGHPGQRFCFTFGVTECVLDKHLTCRFIDTTVMFVYLKLYCMISHQLCVNV